MAGMCCGIVGEAESSASPVDSAVRTARRRRVDLLQLNIISDLTVTLPENGRKRQKIETVRIPVPEPAAARECKNASENCDSAMKLKREASESESADHRDCNPKFGVTSVCGRRRDMEDAVSIQPSFCVRNDENPSGYHFFGVFDGHGCSHVATKCKERMHAIVEEEVESQAGSEDWKGAMERSFSRMDEVVTEKDNCSATSCRCELQMPQCDAVGSTAVVAVITQDKIVVSNCGDSRAVLCRNGVAIPLSVDHKPDRPDELDRIQAAGGRVIYWDSPRVLGVLAMSRAIGDNYLKPYVISEPEVTVTDRTPEDECLILASDGLWDVVTNDTAAAVARMCLSAEKPPSPPQSPGNETAVSPDGEGSDKACSDASILLTKLALARHSADNVSVVVVDLRRDR